MDRDDLLTERRPPAWGRRLAAVMALGAVLAAAGGAWLAALRLSPLAGGFGGVGGAAALLGVGMIVFSAGLGVYVLAPGFLGPAAAWHGVGSHRLVLSSTLLVVVLSNLGPVLYTAFRPFEGLCSVPSFLTAALSVDAALLGVTYVRFIRPGILTAESLGLQPGRLGRHLATGVMVGVGVLILSATIQAILQGLGVRQTQLADFRCIRDFPPAGFLAVVVAGGIVAPIAEELFFRGFVFRSYLLTRGPLVAYPLSSLLFASLHLNLPALLPILTLALVFAWSYQRTGSIVPSVVGHALNNSVAFVALYFADLT
jgi:uncharacterized protein